MARDRLVRRRLPPNQRRQLLLEVGLELLDRKPERAPAMLEVAERAGISPGLLYRYFPDKHAFHQALLAESAARLSAATRWPAGGFAEALRGSLEAQVTFAVRHPGLWHAIQRGAAVRERVHEDQVERTLRGLGAAASSPRARLLLRGWLGFCEAAIATWLRDRSLVRSELVALLAAALEPALVALGARTPPRPRADKPRVRLVASSSSPNP